jgi:hypothetical protein
VQDFGEFQVIHLEESEKGEDMRGAPFRLRGQD